MLWHLLVGWDFLHKCFLPNTTERCSSISASARNAFPLRRFTAGKQRCYSELLYIGSASTRATRLQPADPSNDAHSSVGHSNTNGQSRVHASRGADWEKRRFSAVLALLPHNACDETSSLTSLFCFSEQNVWEISATNRIVNGGFSGCPSTENCDCFLHSTVEVGRVFI